MDKDQPSYYAILTSDVRYSKELSSLQKLLFAEITALSNKTGECWASNGYFAKLYNVSETWISLSIKKLCKLGYLSSVVDDKDGNKRYLSIKLELNTSLTTVKHPSLTRVKHNITSINIKNNIHSKLEYLENIPLEDIKEFTTKFTVSERQLKEKGETLADYCRAKGRKYSNYKAFLRNAIRKDFSVRKPVETKYTVELPPEVKKENIQFMSKLKERIGVR